MNVFGERQHPEKYLPKIINHILNKKVLKIHSNENKTKAGSRFYIHAKDVADAINFILKKGFWGLLRKRMTVRKLIAIHSFDNKFFRLIRESIRHSQTVTILQRIS